VSNWLLGYNQPTAEQYDAMRKLLNSKNGGDYLRREYEDLRRPFNLTKNQQWGDVWRFAIARNRVHPAQKPVAMMEQVVAVSSRRDDTVLEPFGGSFTTAIACIRTGRRFIGIEIDPTYFEIARKRIEAELEQGRLFV
jgi:site-specific DNA-methyltransferase (adenine-specific)